MGKVATYLGSLVQLCSREGGMLQTNTTGMCGECLQWTGLSQPKVAFISRVHTAQAPGCSTTDYLKRALHFMPIPLLTFSGAMQGHRARWPVHFVSFPGPGNSSERALCEHAVPVGPGVLCPSLVPAAWFPRCTVGVQSQVCSVSPLGSWSQAVTLLVGVNHPGSQEDMVSNW